MSKKRIKTLDPRFPKKLVTPLFIEVRDHVPSIAGIIEQELKNNLYRKLRKPLVVTGTNTWKVAGERIYEELTGYKKKDYVIISSNDYSEVEKVMEKLHKKKDIREKKVKHPKSSMDSKYGKRIKGKKEYNIIYAVGGGSVIDVAKYAAYKHNILCVSIPTSLANDGFASQFSVINLPKDGVQTLTANVPVGVIVDISCIVSGDNFKGRIKSGIGDLLSNITAGLDWELADSLGHIDTRYEKLDQDAYFQSVVGAKLILEYILKGEDIYEDVDILKIFAMSLISSAQAMEKYGSSRPASGFEHKLYHMYNKLTNNNTQATHGEIVAIGALISSYAHEKHFDELKKAFSIVGLPTTKKDLHKLGIQKEDLVKSIDNSKNFRRERYTILDKKGVDYMIKCVNEVFR